MLVISRFRYPETDIERAAADLETCRTGLSGQPGYLDGWVGRAVDDPSLWVLATRWANVGASRRALSSYDVKLQVVPLLSHAVDEPSAFELVDRTDLTDLNEVKPRGSGG